MRRCQTPRQARTDDDPHPTAGEECSLYLTPPPPAQQKSEEEVLASYEMQHPAWITFDATHKTCPPRTHPPLESVYFNRCPCGQPYRLGLVNCPSCQRDYEFAPVPLPRHA